MSHPTCTKKQFKSMTATALMGAGLVFFGLSGAAVAENFPTQPIKIVVPFGAGGPADLAGRAFGQYMAEQLGGNAVVENKGGGGGIVALNSVANAAPDGHTLYFAASGNITVQPLLMNPPLDVNDKLRPVAQVTSSPHGLFVSGKLPVNTVEEFIAYAKAHPGELNFATPGVGGLGHLGVEAFKKAAGIDAETIHYKGAAAALQDMISGEVHAMVNSVGTLKPLVDQGQLKVLGVTGPSSAGFLKEMPLVSQTLPDFSYTTWYSFYAPKDTPDDVVEKMSQALSKADQNEELVENLRKQGIDVTVSTPAELQKLADKDTAVWKQVISDANISLK
ncbi:Bug family tripartite tricarboxylate transporter substrate binding protein [Orrella sp. 11846]|uniref:Bug family tripartite tricarboxylate transporter substrate binding protein n=1 Tax=Orrella sp. 11846 TaxID=3409913 RepID=UPI003B592C1F